MYGMRSSSLPTDWCTSQSIRARSVCTPPDHPGARIGRAPTAIAITRLPTSASFTASTHACYQFLPIIALVRFVLIGDATPTMDEQTTGQDGWRRWASTNHDSACHRAE